jgi:hypothetical protein
VTRIEFERGGSEVAIILKHPVTVVASEAKHPFVALRAATLHPPAPVAVWPSEIARKIRRADMGKFQKCCPGNRQMQNKVI